MKSVFSLLLLLGAMLAGAAQAQGFVDERSKAKPPAAAGSEAAPAAATGSPSGVANVVVQPAPPPAPEPPKTIAHELRTGQPIHTELKRWADFYGWDFYWYHDRSWKTLRDTTILKANFDEAVTEVIDILRTEGKPLRLRISEGNRVMEVLSTEVRND
jgi:hypothetical protein